MPELFPAHDHFVSAVDAVDWLLANRRDAIRKALNPLDRRDHAKIALRLSSAIKGITGPEEANAMRDALKALDVNWTSLDQKARERVIVAAKRSLANNLPPRIEPRIQEQFRIFGKPIARGSKRFAVTNYKLDIGTKLNSQDVKLAQFAARSPVNFIRDEYGKRSDTMGKRVREIVAQGIERGAGSREIVQNLKQQIGDLGKLGRGDFYWEVVSLAFTNRARTIGQLNSFAEAGIERYVWESVLDEVTTETCRFLHGKVFSTSATLQTVEQAEAQSDDPEALKLIQPWISNGRDEQTGEKHMFYRGADGAKVVVATIQQGAKGKPDEIGKYTPKITDKGLQDQGLSMPPIHGLCRSTILPDLTGPQPNTAPASRPRAPAAPQGAPKPKPPPFPEKGVHFEHFFSNVNDPETERRALSAIAECGALPMLQKKPLGRIVFTNDYGTSRLDNLVIDKGANGEYFSEGRFSKNQLESRSVLKVRTARGLAADIKTPARTNAQTGWSVSEARTGPVNKTRGTMVHEIGHHIHMEGIGINPFTGQPDYDLSTDEFIKVDKIVQQAFNGRPSVSHLAPAEPLVAITGYSESSHREYFAEAFALHFFDPAALRARDKRAYDMVEQVRKIRKLAKPDRTLAKSIGLISEAIEKASSWVALTKITREASELFEAGKLTIGKLDKLEEKARAVEGSSKFEGWIEDFLRYREWLFFPELYEFVK